MKKISFQELFEKKAPVKAREWRTENSIFKFLLSNQDSSGRLTSKAYQLPDQTGNEDTLRFAPGLADAILQPEGNFDSGKKVNQLCSILKKVSVNGDKFGEWEFYKLITESERVIDIIDAVLNTIISDSTNHSVHLFSFAKSLATMTDKRNAVKFGIAMLGVCQDDTVIEDLKILGSHDEFTVYATVAIMNLSSHPVGDLWELGKKVDGWGKIQLVGRLSEMELSQEIKDWLVMEGYKNNIMNEYLALTCAIHGELYKKIACEVIDEKLFKSASDLIVALIQGDGSSEDISGYNQADNVIKDFIYHARSHTKDLNDFIALHTIKEYLTELHQNIEEQMPNGWSQDILSNCLIDIVEILKSREWQPQIYEGLKSHDKETYRNAKQAAEKAGIALWDIVWKRLCENPVESAAWYDVIHYCTPDHANQLIHFALDHLPLDECAGGPKDSMGLGADYEKFMSLDYVITFLENFPQKGEKIILTGLQSPVTRNRNMALKVLDKWKKEHWSPEITAAILQLQKTEPNNNTRKNINRLLNGSGLE